MGHLRSATTTSPASQSRNELERILARYGCERWGHDLDRGAGSLTVWFTVTDSKLADAGPVPVRIRIELASVRDRLNALPASKHIGKAKLLDPEHVERVAWRHLVFLVEAGLVAAEAGIKKVSEFFLADTVVETPQGNVRFIDALESGDRQWKALLGKGSPV
jgi:hypothetical protein